MIIGLIAVIIIAFTTYLKWVERDTTNKIANIQQEKNNG